MCGVDPDESRARYVEDWLEVPVDELAVILVHTRLVAEAERRSPPGDIVIARNGYHATHFLRVADEDGRALEFSRARALGEIAGDCDDIELAVVDDSFDRFDLFRDRRPAEMQIGDVKDRRHAFCPRRGDWLRARRRDPRNGLQRWR